ncbi:MAG: hypothetical protein ACJ790_12610 [Myxococcaceae bacterium]
MKAPRGSLLHVFLAIVGVVVLLVIAAALLVSRRWRQVYEVRIQERRQLATLVIDNFCAEQGRVAADPFFHEQRTPGDASEFFGKWLPLEDAGKASPIPGSPLAIPPELPQSNGQIEDWLTKPLDVSKADFRWMKELYRYDRWDLSHWRGAGASGKFELLSLPFLPNLSVLTAWAKYRLLDGIARKDPASASRDVRQLAWLFYRTDTLLGGMSATMLLGLDRSARDAHLEFGDDWKPMTREQIDRLRRVVWGGAMLQQVTLPTAIAERARTCGAPPVSRCIGVNEAVFAAAEVGPLIPSEFSEELNALRKAVELPDCSPLAKVMLEDGSSLIESPPVSGPLRGAFGLDADLEKVIRHLPRMLSREAVGTFLLSDSVQPDKLTPFLDAGVP